MNAETLVVPLWAAIGAGSTVAVALVGVVVWVFTVFLTKDDHKNAHEDHENRIKALEQNWTEIKSDLSYIRGRLEPK